ncbi:MAG: Ig-like domain-containing protein, partial [bacterium]
FPAEGVYVLVLTADDGEHTVEDSVTVTVLSDLSNQPPEAFDTLAVTVLDTAIEISLSYSDADGPGPYTYSHGVPTNGTVSGTGPLFSYRPDPGFAGRDSFWWRVDDGLNVSNQATVTIDVRSPQSTFEGILIDHNDIDAFERIPLEYVAAARDLTMVFSDRSVGMNLDQALDCFMSPSFESSPSHCRRDYTFVEPGGYWWTQNLDPEERPQALPLEQITYDPDPELYSRNNWLFEFREGTWDALTENFIEDLVPTHLAENDIVTYQFSYINNDPWLVDPECGYFATENRSGCPSHLSDWHVGRIEELEAMHPDKAFIYWTTSLNRNSEPVLTEFNDQMRDWALVNQKVLFDFADIESHNPDGSACVDGSDDEPFYYNGRFREDFEDDGVDTPAICRRYTSEITGGHLGAVSGGKIRLVKGLWLVMACIAGWDDPVCGP